MKKNKKILSIFLFFLIILLGINFTYGCIPSIFSGVSGASKENEINYFNNEEIILPEPVTDSGFSLEKSLFLRRSVRTFSDKEIEFEKISQLLWSAQGITDERTGFRTTPSAGALYPLDVFLLNQEGVFHYMPDGHKLFTVSTEDKRKELYSACFFQSPVSEAVINIVITAVYERTTGKYGNRGIRYVDIEAGHCGQNILLSAVSMGLAAVPIGAFNDGQVQKILNVPKEYVPLYVIPVGYPRQ